MRDCLKLGTVKLEDVKEETVQAVAETLRKSSSLKVSEDGMTLDWFLGRFVEKFSSYLSFFLSPLWLYVFQGKE